MWRKSIMNLVTGGWFQLSQRDHGPLNVLYAVYYSSVVVGFVYPLSANTGACLDELFKEENL